MYVALLFVLTMLVTLHAAPYEWSSERYHRRTTSTTTSTPRPKRERECPPLIRATDRLQCYTRWRFIDDEPSSGPGYPVPELAFTKEARDRTRPIQRYGQAMYRRRNVKQSRQQRRHKPRG